MSNQFGSGPTALRGGGLTNFNPYAQQGQFGPRQSGGMGGGIPGYVPQPQMMPQMQARPLPGMAAFNPLPSLRPGFAPMPMKQPVGGLKFPLGGQIPQRPQAQPRMMNNAVNPKTNLNPFK